MEFIKGLCCHLGYTKSKQAGVSESAGEVYHLTPLTLNQKSSL